MKIRKNCLLAVSIGILVSGLAQTAFADTTDPATTGETASESSFVTAADEKWSKMIASGNEMLAAGKSTPAINMFKQALRQAQKAAPTDQTAGIRMCAICSKKLGQAYLLKPDYLKADASLKEAKTAYDKLSLRDEDLDKSIADLGKYYRTIEVNSLGDSVTGYLKEAGVNKIAVFHKDDGDLVEINLDQKYVKPIESKDVPKVSFSKKVSFQFFSKPNGDYQVSKIQGLQVLAKSLWVNLLESLLKVGATPVAEVTAGKMGMTKTVTVNIPTEIYDSTKNILDKIVASLKGQPAYAATTTDSSSPLPASETTTPSQTDASSSTEDTEDTSAQGSAPSTIESSSTSDSPDSSTPPPSQDPQGDNY